MQPVDPRIPPPEELLVLTRELARVISPGPVLRRQERSGKLVRVRRGAYMAAADWSQRSVDERYRALVRATALAHPSGPVVSHQSAAALWGLPVLGAWPADVHLTVERASGGRSDPGVRRHAVGVDAEHVTTLHGLAVTTLARTVVDLAATLPLHSAVAVVDAAIHTSRNGKPRLTKAVLLEVHARLVPFRGFRRAAEVLEFAESGAGSPRESASRVTIALAGFPTPELQRRFTVGREHFFVDFYWPEAAVIGECDGFAKYADREYLRGSTAADAVMEEKRREDALRASVSGFARWEGREALDRAVLSKKLLAAGLTPGRATRTLRQRGS